MCFEAVLKKPVKLEFIEPLYYDIPNVEVTSDQRRLGEEAILGDTFRDEVPALSVEISGAMKTRSDGMVTGSDGMITGS